MLVGFARVDITPPVGTDLSGFIAREGPSTGVHDRLFARALVFDDGSERAAVVSADIIGFGASLVRRVRQRVATRSGIPPENQLYSATHTHGGPETGPIPTIATPDLAYLCGFEESLVEAVERAREAIEPALLGFGEGRSSMGQNRILARDGDDGPYDPVVGVLRVAGLSGLPLATVVSYACHATAAGPTRLINADYPGRLASTLEASGCGPIVFLNGAGADVNPRSLEGRGVEQAERVGDALAADVRQVWGAVTPGEWIGVRGHIEAVRLPLGPLPEAAEAARIQAEGRRTLEAVAPGSVEARGVAITHARYSAMLAQIHFGSASKPEVTSEVQALEIGPVVFVALPGEAFSSVGRAIRGIFGKPVVVAGWANDLVGYIPDETAYERGGYEVETAHRYYGLPAPFTTAARDGLLDGCQRLAHWLAVGPAGT